MNDQVDIWEMALRSGIVVQGILFLLFFCSIASWVVAFKKRKNYIDLKDNELKFLNFYLNNKSLKEIFHKSQDFVRSPSGLIFQKGYHEFLRFRNAIPKEGEATKRKEYFQRYGIKAIERSLKKGMNEVNEELEVLLPILASFGAICPFIGLFGTVWGIVNAFTGLATGGATLDVVAPGIAEALVTTVIGLFASIPSVIFYNYFSSINLKINSQMDTFAQEFLNMIERLTLSQKK